MKDLKDYVIKLFIDNLRYQIIQNINCLYHMNLVIVESPSKANTITKYLGKDYYVLPSYGHVRDLPSKSGSVIPENDFQINYTITSAAQKYVSQILLYAKKTDVIYLATDPDREGESIAWHILEIIKTKIKKQITFKRISFYEITQSAVINAIKNPRNVDINLVNAQQARRALDYLVGFHLSPILWRKLPGCKSAGRVQSVALKLICTREEEIETFISKEYWDIKLILNTKHNQRLEAILIKIDNQKLTKFSLTKKIQVDKIVNDLNSEYFIVSDIIIKNQQKNPNPPFITSSLQQEAAYNLGFKAKKTMVVAQKLYEGIKIHDETIGLITYMRTDSTNISKIAVSAIRELILKEYGKEYLPTEQRIYKSKVKNAQESHECIRPTDINLIPDSIKHQLEKDEFNLYNLIWKRTVASQMKNMLTEITNVILETPECRYSAKITKTDIIFNGYTQVFNDIVESNFSLNQIKTLAIKDILTLHQVLPVQHFTEPPTRYSEGSLIKKLEELGIGRPSTYAPIISIIQERNYVLLQKKCFIPCELGRIVTAFLSKFFQKYVEYDFTAKLEYELDEIALGNIKWKSVLQNFWIEFLQHLKQIENYTSTHILSNIQEVLHNYLFQTDELNTKCNKCKNGNLHLKLSKFGAFLACDNYPECIFTKNIVDNKDSSETVDKLIGYHENEPVYLKQGPYGKYIQLNNRESQKIKKISIPQNLFSISTNIDIEYVKNLIQLPYRIGLHPITKKEITLNIGKYGYYIRYENNCFALKNTQIDPFKITIDDAITILEKKSKK